MTTAKRRWLPIVAGIVALVVILGIVAAGVSFVWLREHMTMAHDVTRTRADEVFTGAAQAFADGRPAFEVGDDRRPRPLAGAPRRNPGAVTAIRVLAWDAEKAALADVTLPLWLVRLKSGPIEFGGYAAGFDDHGVKLTAEEIERLGPGVLIDYRAPNGDHVLLSAQ